MQTISMAEKLLHSRKRRVSRHNYSNTHTETQSHRVSERDTLLYIEFAETASP